MEKGEKLMHVAAMTVGLPTPQRVLKAGLKILQASILLSDLRTRFGCWAIAEAINVRTKAEVEAEMLKSDVKISPSQDESAWHGQRIIYPGHEHYEKSKKYSVLQADKGVSWSYGYWRLVECNVKLIEIEQYQETIPEAVLLSYLAARELGLTAFSIALPQITPYPIETRPGRVLLAALYGMYIEVDAWD